MVLCVSLYALDQGLRWVQTSSKSLRKKSVDTELSKG